MIKNFKQINQEKITFDITNDIKYSTILNNKKIMDVEMPIDISLINGLRRIISTDINVYCIKNKIDFIKNTSLFDSDCLILRLSLIPIISTLKIDYNDVIITCDITNTTEMVKSVYARDLVIKVKNEILPVNKIIVYPDIIICKLKYIF